MFTTTRFRSTLCQAALAYMWFLLSCGCTKPTTQATQAESESRPLQLKVVSFVNSRLPVIGETLVRLTERLDTASGGNIKMRMYEPGKLVAALEVLDAVSSGKVEAGFSSAGFWMGKMPATPIFSAVPFGPRASEFLSWLVAGNGMALYHPAGDRLNHHNVVSLYGHLASCRSLSGRRGSSRRIGPFARGRLMLLERARDEPEKPSVRMHIRRTRAVSSAWPTR